MKSRQELIEEQNRLLEIFEVAKTTLMQIPGVVDVAIGLKQTSGKFTDQITFQVFVREKKSLSSLSTEEIIPSEILGVKTDVIILPTKETLRTDASEHRPITAGVQIGNGKGHVGTLGCFARLADNSLVLLTNQHVLFSDGAVVGEKIGQPDVEDYCCCCCAYTEGIIGEILNPGINNNLVDCALAKVNTNIVPDVIVANSMSPTEIHIDHTQVAVVGETVRKIGRTSGLTTGLVTSINGPSPGKINQIWIQPVASETYTLKANSSVKAFSDHGDSGSVIINASNQIIGMLYSGDDGNGSAIDTTFANNIQDILNALANAGIGITIENTPPGRAASFSRKQIYPQRIDQEIRQRLLQSENGQLYVSLFEQHQKEVLKLINHNKKVTVLWQRHHGPAFMAHVIKSVKDQSYKIPQIVGGTTFQQLFITMASILKETGSTELRASIEKYGIEIIHLTYKYNSAIDFIEKIGDESLSHMVHN